LEKLGLTTLKKRRERGDTIQYYKIEKGLNKVEYVATNRAAPALNSIEPAANIRGYAHRLERQAVKDCAQREYFFEQNGTRSELTPRKRIVNAKNTNDFENLLDKLDKAKRLNREYFNLFI
jgi:hypothetical protein